MAVFSLQEVKKLQVQNVIDNNFASWPEDANYGYYGGGYSPTQIVSTIARIDSSTETITAPGNNFPGSIVKCAAISSGVYGYFAGGNFPDPGSVPNTRCNIMRLDFANETVSDPGTNGVPQRISAMQGFSQPSYGYFGGGDITPSAPPSYISTIRKFDFSSETVTNLTNTFSSGKIAMAAVSNETYGYFCGGYDGVSPISTVSRLDILNETVSDPINMPSMRAFPTGVANKSYGYFLGGVAPPFTPYGICTIIRLDFASESFSDPGNDYPSGVISSSVTSTNSYGYFGGGQTGLPAPDNNSCTITRLDFSTETIGNPGSNLPYSRRLLSAVSGGASVARGNGYKTYGYYGGGYKPPADYESRIERIDFSTQTDSIMPSRLIYQHSLANTVSSNNHGYFVGGFVPNPTFPNQTSKVQRFDFISEIISELPSQAPFEAAASGTLSNSQYGFVAGGLKGSPIGSGNNTLVIRLDFSSDSMSQPSSNLTESRNSLNGVSDLRNNLGYFGGGSVSCRICRIDLSSDTITQNSVDLQRDSNAARTYQTGDYGYWAGGKYTPNYSPPSARAFSSTQKIAFSTGTTQYAPPMNTGRYAGGVSQDNYYAWYAAGTAPGFTYTSNVQRVELSTETYSNPGNPLAINRASMIGGLSN